MLTPGSSINAPIGAVKGSLKKKLSDGEESLVEVSVWGFKVRGAIQVFPRQAGWRRIEALRRSPGDAA